MALLHYTEAIEQAQEAVEGLDILEFRAQNNTSIPEIEVLRSGRKSTGVLTFGGVPLSQKGLKGLCTFLSVPAPFLANQEPDFQAYVLNHVAQRSSFTEGVRAIMRGGSIDQWADKDKVFVADTRILDTIAEVVEDLDEMAVLDIQKAYFGSDQSSYSVYFTGTEHEVTQGDTLYPGFHIWNSPLGMQDPCINFYIYRKVCSNGLMRPVSDYHESLILQDMDYPTRVREFLVRQLPNAFKEAVEFGRLREIPIDDPNKAVFSLAQQLKLSRSRRDDLLYLMDAESHPETMYDLVNLLTSYANHQTPKAAVALQQAAGRSLEFLKTSSVCSSCHSIVPFGREGHDESHESDYEDEALVSGQDEESDLS